MQTSTIKKLSICLMLFVASPCCCFAQARPNTTTMSCKSAAGLVSAKGAIVLETGPVTYDRYVTGDGYCQTDETTKPAFVPTTDNSQCFIGYYCFSKETKDIR
jgi:hypothetical protein